MSRYFSLDELLAEDERVPVRWLNAAPGVGYLDASTGSEVRLRAALCGGGTR